jgi:hypothetical protein
VFNIGLVRLALNNWRTKTPRLRSAAARELANQIIDEGLRDEMAASLPPDLTDSMDRFLFALRDWNG